MFLKDEGFVDYPDGRYPKEELYKEYSDYCRASGFKSLNKNNFGKRLTEVHQIEDGKSGSTRYWKLLRDDAAK